MVPTYCLGKRVPLLFQAAVFVVRMKGHVVGRSCGEALLRKVSSAEP